MSDPVAFVHDVQHLHAVQPSHVVRLSARGRVKGRSIQIGAHPTVEQLDYLGGKVSQIRIVIVESLGHL